MPEIQLIESPIRKSSSTRFGCMNLAFFNLLLVRQWQWTSFCNFFCHLLKASTRWIIIIKWKMETVQELRRFRITFQQICGLPNNVTKSSPKNKTKRIWFECVGTFGSSISWNKSIRILRLIYSYWMGGSVVCDRRVSFPAFQQPFSMFLYINTCVCFISSQATMSICGLFFIRFIEFIRMLEDTI